MSRRSAPLCASLLAATVLMGCKAQSTTQAQPSSGSAPAAPAPASAFPVVHGDWAKLGYRLDWVGFPFPGAKGSSKVLTLQPHRDLVVAQDSLSTVTVMEAATGRVRWSSDLTGPLTKWTGIVREEGEAGRLLVSSESELFMMAVGTGTLVGRERYERVVNTAPLPAGPCVVAGTSTGVVQAHLVGRNVSAWNHGMQGAIDARLARVGDYIAAVSQAGDISWLTDNGSLVGRARILGPLDCAPATDGNALFIAGRDQSVWAFDTAGNQLWRYRTSNPLRRSPVVHDGVVYCDLGALGLTAFDAASGVVKWHAKDVHGVVIGVRAKRLLVRDDAGITTVDPARGDAIDRVTLPGVGLVAPDTFVDGNLYAISNTGVLAKFTLR